MHPIRIALWTAVFAICPCVPLIPPYGSDSPTGIFLVFQKHCQSEGISR